MNDDTINKLREVIERCARHEIDAFTALYRIDNVLGAEDGRYVLEHVRHYDDRMRVLYRDDEEPR